MNKIEVIKCEYKVKVLPLMTNYHVPFSQSQQQERNHYHPSVHNLWLNTMHLLQWNNYC